MSQAVTIACSFSSPHSSILTSLPPTLHQIAFLLQINKHYQRVADYGLVEAVQTALCLTGWMRKPQRRTQMEKKAENTKVRVCLKHEKSTKDAKCIKQVVLNVN